ncbi:MULTISPECIES: acetyl-CoA carboxylase biotin carboxylase subunit family protein [unclassified Planococcus (in: firmicutes)]|uniref:ATP-grasp domain-containing protein n=2 Tax=Planococcus TaxID=1372 RepID=UPI0015E159DC|nr:MULTISPECIES: ATP-grasp domain-containing protein [unclassified Planococcus (in: firmicutes)]
MKSKTKVVLLIESGNLGAEIERITAEKFKVIYVCSGILPFDPSNKQYLLEYIEDKKITDFKFLRNLVLDISNKYRLLNIYTTSDFYSHYISKIAEELKYPGLNSETALIVSKKNNFRNKQKEINYKYPEYHILSNLQTGIEILKNENKSYIFKPINGNESLGVKLISTKEELVESYNSLLKLGRYTNNLIDSTQYLLEEYIEGKIYSCEFIKDYKNLTILGITNRVVSEKPYFIEIGYTFPYFDSNINKLIIQATEKFVDDFDYDFGPCHIEFIVDENNQVIILEVNPRLVGWPNYWMINETLECDIFSAINNLYTNGELCSLNLSPHRYSSCIEVVTPIEGFFKGFSTRTEWKFDPDVLIIQNIPDNTYLKTPKSNRDILARILTKGESMEQAKIKALEIYDDLKINIVIRADSNLRSL